MCDPVTATIAAVGGIGGSLLGARQQKKALAAQKRAQEQNLAAQAKLQGDAAKAEANARRTPNYGALFAQNAEKRGVASTLLTGAGGVGTGTLARATLLGG